MKIEALKPFPVSPDGSHTRHLAVGATLDVSTELGEALVKAQLAKAVSQPEPADPSTSRPVMETAEADDDNPFVDPDEDEDEGEDKPEAEGKPKPARKTTRKPRENKDAGNRSRRS